MPTSEGLRSTPNDANSSSGSSRPRFRIGKGPNNDEGTDFTAKPSSIKFPRPRKGDPLRGESSGDGFPEPVARSAVVTSPSSSRPLVLAALSAVAFGAMAFAAKLASNGLSGAQVACLRFAFMLAPLAWPSVFRQAIVVQRIDLLLYRGFFGGVAVLFYFLAIAHTSVSLATLLNYSAPIWSVLFASRFLGERVDRRLLVPLIAASAGVLLVVRGQSPSGGALPHSLDLWTGVGLLSAILSGAAVTSLRAARRTESSWSIYSSFTLFGLLVTLPFAIVSWRPPNREQWLALVAVGLFSIVAQLLMTHVYRWLTNLQVGICSQLAIVVAMALGITFLDEPANRFSLVGSALAIAAILAVVAVQATPRATE